MRRGASASHPRPDKITQELRLRLHATDHQEVPSTRASHVQQVPLGLENHLKIGGVTHLLDSLLQWYHVVVTRHHGDRAELKALRQMHRHQ